MEGLEDIKTLVTEFTTKAGATLDAQKAEIADLKTKLAKETKDREQIELKVGRLALSGNGNGEVNGDLVAERKAVSAFVRTGDETELKAMQVGSDPAGGYFVMPAMSAGMTKKLFDYSPMRRLARVEVITAGDAWEEPIDRNEVTATWVGETGTRSVGTSADIGKLRVPVDEIYALQQVTQRLLDDAAFDVGGWVEGKIGDKFARSEGAAFVSGTGVGQPQGFLNYPTPVTTADSTRAEGVLQYVKTAGASDFASGNPGDALVNTVYTLRAPYRSGASWLMNSTVAGKIRKFKDGQGNYMWQPTMAAGQPDALLGYPVEIDENMPDVGSDTFPVAFGNFNLGYVIVEKAGLRLLRDPYSSKPNVLFYAYRRVGGRLANSEAIKLVKCEA